MNSIYTRSRNDFYSLLDAYNCRLRPRTFDMMKMELSSKVMAPTINTMLTKFPCMRNICMSYGPYFQMISPKRGSFLSLTRTSMKEKGNCTLVTCQLKAAFPVALFHQTFCYAFESNMKPISRTNHAVFSTSSPTFSILHYCKSMIHVKLWVLCPLIYYKFSCC